MSVVQRNFVGRGKSCKHSCCRKVKVLNILKVCLLSWLSYPVYPAPQYFSTLSHKRHDLIKKTIQHTKHIFVFATTLKHFSF